MDKSVRLVIERMKTAKKIKIEFDMEIMPIHNDKILAHDIAIAFQGYANRQETRKNRTNDFKNVLLTSAKHSK